MGLSIIPKNRTYVLEIVVINCDGDFVSGLNITYEVRKSSDNTLITSGTLSEMSGSETYIDTVTFSTADQYRIVYTSPTGYENGFEQIMVEDIWFDDLDTLLDTIFDKVCRILGLSQQNYRFTDQVYNSDGCMTSATITIYPSAVDTENDTNAIATYSVTAVYTLGRLTDYKVVEI